MNELDQKLLGARILSEANDLKRTLPAMAKDLGISESSLKEAVQGKCSIDDQIHLVKKMGEKYPIDSNELLLPEDDCKNGIKIMRREESEASARITERKDKNGKWTPYYEYRDTVFTKLAYFRPEWIRQLRDVEDCDPRNPDVQFNRGHLAYQYTLYVGPVNFYWEINGEKHGREMQTGDSTYGTPFWPHTFACREKGELAYILAVTFGGAVRMAQKEFYRLGEKARGYMLNSRKPTQAVAQLIEQHLANDDLTKDDLEERLQENGQPVQLDAILKAQHHPSYDEFCALAKCLQIEPSDLMMPEYSADHEVAIKPFGPSGATLFPSSSQPYYRIHRMVRLPKLPLVRGSIVEVQNSQPQAALLQKPFQTSLHGWLYNFGKTDARIYFENNSSSFEETVRPGDSVYIQPFTRYAFANVNQDDPNARLCVIRIPGTVNLSTQRELSYFSEIDRVIFESGCWFNRRENN